MFKGGVGVRSGSDSQWSGNSNFVLCKSANIEDDVLVQEQEMGLRVLAIALFHSFGNAVAPPCGIVERSFWWLSDPDFFRSIASMFFCCLGPISLSPLLILNCNK